MKIIIIRILSLMTLYSFLETSLSQETNNNHSLSNINSLLLTNNCSSYNDCFNCSIISTCRWNSSIEKCISYEPYNSDFSIIKMNPYDSNDLQILNNYFNFLRKVCFLPTTPMMRNNNNKYYNYNSVKYCGNHYIMTSENDLEKNFKIALNKIDGKYGTPNLLCEYIFFSGPNSFKININIDQDESKNFYLLFSEDSIYFTKILNYSTKLEIDMSLNKLNTLIFFGFKSFDSPPFTITSTPGFWTKTVQATGYIMLALIIVIIIIVIYAIIYIRKNSINSKKKKKAQSNNEKQKQKNKYNKVKSEEINFTKKDSKETNITSPSLIKNFNPETPLKFIEENKFSFEKCVVDGQFFNNDDKIYKANCGHFYHENCYNKLKKEKLDDKDGIKCVICQNNI